MYAYLQEMLDIKLHSNNQRSVTQDKTKYVQAKYVTTRHYWTAFDIQSALIKCGSNSLTDFEEYNALRRP
jgi:hypothetical protein